MTMIERVARAMYDLHPLRHWKAGYTDGGPMTWDEAAQDTMHAGQTRALLEYARAAVEAMRDPTEVMLQAGYDWQCSDWPDDWHNDESGITPELYTATHIWPAMIAAALGEP